MTSHTNFIGGKWQAAEGAGWQSTDPYNDELIWEGLESSANDVNRAVLAARAAAADWASRSLEDRQGILTAYADSLAEAKTELAELISREVGKPLWESTGEAGAMIGKIAISIKAFADRCGDRETPVGADRGVTTFKPHGAVGVFGPFNFPGHLPNGHIVPALLAGNTVVFKPSEVTPAVGERMVQLFESSGLPAGVLNLVQGGRETGIALAKHQGLDGLFFTGSSSTGKAIHKSFGGAPEKILALEMGGNNPLVVHDIDDMDAAVYWTIQSAYITAGQRCVCARRLILVDSEQSEAFVDRLVEALPKIKVGHYKDSPEPFIGPVISAAAAKNVLTEQAELIEKGAKPLHLAAAAPDSVALLTPGLIDVTSVSGIADEEIFGPLLQLIRVPNFEAAVAAANDTVYGLAAGIFCRKKSMFDDFRRQVTAGIVNWNKPTTGASSAAPFGGVGQSGNHNPSAYFAADYCSYPVASIESDAMKMPESLSPGLNGLL